MCYNQSMENDFYKISLVSVYSIICAICGVFAVVLYLFGVEEMAYIFVAACCLFLMLILVPASIARMTMKNSAAHNFLIFLSSAYIMLLLLFLIVTFTYLCLFHTKMFEFFEVVFYPATLAILLNEYIISYKKKTTYLNSINSTQETFDEEN